MDILALAAEIRDFLRNLSLEDPVQAAAYLEFLSAAKEEKIEKRLKTEAYAVLDAAAPGGEFDFNGIIIEKVNQTKTVWNRTGEVTIAEGNLKLAKEALDKAQREAGFETVPGNKYWQIKKAVTDPAEAPAPSSW